MPLNPLNPIVLSTFPRVLLGSPPSILQLQGLRTPTHLVADGHVEGRGELPSGNRELCGDRMGI